MFSAHTTLVGAFGNGVFTLKTHQMFSVHTTPEEFKNATITGHFAFVFEENSGREITWLSWRYRFRKVPFSNCSSSTLKRKVGVMKFLRFDERFRIGEKLRFRDGLVWTIGLTVEIKAAFSNLSGVVRMGPLQQNYFLTSRIQPVPTNLWASPVFIFASIFIW